MANYTIPSDFTFKHVNQVDVPDISAEDMKTYLDSQAKSLRDYLIATLLPELESAKDDVDAHKAENAIDAHATIPSCAVTNSVNQSIADITFTAISMDTENWDTDTMHDNATNNSRITIKTAGKYQIIGGVSFANNTTGFRIIGIRVNGTTLYGQQKSAPIAGSMYIEVTDILNLAVNDYVELIVYQSSGTAINSEHTIPFPFLKAIKVG